MKETAVPLLSLSDVRARVRDTEGETVRLIPSVIGKSPHSDPSLCAAFERVRARVWINI